MRNGRMIVLAAILCLILFGYQIAKIYTDWQWFGELGQSGVFSTSIGARITLFFGFGILFFLICYFNLWLAQRLNASRPRPRAMDSEHEKVRIIARQATHWLSLGASVFIAFLVAANAAGHWPQYLQFTHAGEFGVKDPVFQNDVGFYVFRLPFLAFLVNWFLAAFVVTTIAVAVVHYSDGALDFMSQRKPEFAPHVERHVLALLGLSAITYAMTYSLSRYELLFADNDFFSGAGYTDLHVRLPAITGQMLAMLATGVLCIVNIWRGRAFRLPIMGIAAWLLISLIGGGLLPGMVEKFTVVPNQFSKQQEYIARDIKLTQQAYGLGPDRVKIQDFSGAGEVTARSIADDKTTINSIRLWDWPQLAQVYTANQALRTYYRFTLPPTSTMTSGDTNIDVDRYRIGNEYRQVMLAPRELYPPGLPPQAQTWQNLRLQYTHGFGVVMSPVNRTNAEGLPEYFLSQIPVKSSVSGLTVDRPQIYYGELTRDYVFADTRQNEFDYPSDASDAKNKETRYTGKGGVPLSGTFGKLAWSLRLGDTNMLLSGDFTEKSRILFRRGIRERVQVLAPFLQLDNDPYLVVDGGKLLWIQDAYTVTDRYPYSKPTRIAAGPGDWVQEFNYIRNAVKAVVDAYDGTVTLYVAEKADPIIETWSRIFPTLFTSIDKMPASLKAHIRYPEDLFRIQRDVYCLYHINDERVYYGKEDVWQVPGDPTAASDGDSILSGEGPQTMMPYYVLMKLPGEKSEEFLMMTPFTPLAKQNISAWMCAKCDPDDYGQLLVYRFPRGSNVNGPQQVMSQVNSTQEISQYMTLVNQKGSRVVFGNLLVIPVESALLYVIPVYVQANAPGASVIPEINKVIVATSNRIAMRSTLEAAIAAVAGGGPPTEESPTGAAGAPGVQPPKGQAPGRPASVPELVKRANDAYRQAREREKEYQRSLDDLGKTLDELQRGTTRK